MLLIGLGLLGLMFAVGAAICIVSGRQRVGLQICAIPVVFSIVCWAAALLVPVSNEESQVQAQFILLLAVTTTAIAFVTLLGAGVGILSVVGKTPTSIKQITPGGTL